jgi:hypothetical protein
MIDHFNYDSAKMKMHQEQFPMMFDSPYMNPYGQHSQYELEELRFKQFQQRQMESFREAQML